MTTSTDNKPHSAMILAAGLGTRMRPLSLSRPKPLIPVYGKPLIDRAIDVAVRAGVRRTIVNVHYLADQVEEHVRAIDETEIIISNERDSLLETGGGITKALSALGSDAFYLLNSDSFWLEGVRSNLDLLADQWVEDDMDALLLLSPTVQAVGYEGKGDFLMDAEGHLIRRKEKQVSPFVYSGAAILHPRLFASAPDGKFSLNLLFDKAIAERRLYGLSMDGIWMHVGTPCAIKRAEKAIAESVITIMID